MFNDALSLVGRVPPVQAGEAGPAMEGASAGCGRYVVIRSFSPNVHEPSQAVHRPYTGGDASEHGADEAIRTMLTLLSVACVIVSLVAGCKSARACR